MMSTGAALAQAFGALARVIPEETRVETGGGGVTLRLGLSQPVPFRVFALDDPRRVVVDFREVIWDGVPDAFGAIPGVSSVEVGAAFEAGWSRMVLALEAPMLPRIAAMETDASSGQAAVILELASVPPKGSAMPPACPMASRPMSARRRRRRQGPPGRPWSSCSTPAMAASIPGPCGAITPRPTSS
jgi:N-acetylmuramoyl-L-alanine amidase